MSHNQNGIEKLKGRENYDTWVISARSYLRIKGLWRCFSADHAENADAATIEKYEKALSELTLLLDTSCYSYIAGKETAKEAWESITTAFSDTGKCRRSALLQQLVSMKLADCKSMEDVINKFKNVWTKVKSVYNIDEDVAASLMLGGLPQE